MTKASSRDYTAEMRAVIDKALDRPSFTAAELALEIVTELRGSDPDLLNGWLNLSAETLLKEFIRQVVQLHRSRVRTQRPDDQPPPAASKPVNRMTESEKRSVFRYEAAKSQQGGDSGVGRFGKDWLNSTVKVKSEQWRLADMNSIQLNTAADEYQHRAKSHLMHEAFLRAVAKQLAPGQVVRDCFTDERLDGLWASFKR